MLGPTDMILIGGIALLVFGPKRLPELAKALGSGIRDFKKALNGEDEAEEKEKKTLPAEEAKPKSPDSETPKT